MRNRITLTRNVPRVALVLALALSVTVAAAPVEALPPWSPPVAGPAVRAFDPPASPYGAGHRGIDYTAPPGTPVRAAGPGSVSFAGTVGGSVHVVVAHPGGLRTTYSFLQRARVRRGDEVGAGTVVGEAGGTAPGHVGVLHLSLRRGDTYLDPALLFAPPDLTEVVHLAPDGDPPRLAPTGAERAAIVSALLADDGGIDLVGGLSGLAGTVGGWAGTLADGGAEALHALIGGVSAAIDPVADVLARAARRLSGLLHAIERLHPMTLTNGMVFEIGRALADWIASRDECDPAAPAADGTGGSAHRVMVVAGIDSQLAEGGSSLPRLPADALGYLPGDVSYYSYAEDGSAYEREDTYVPIEAAAERLAEQLRALQAAQPGREVDLLAHSQGGVVVLAFLKLVYDPADTAYPPLGTIVTLSSPLGGTPSAGAIRYVATSGPGHQLLQALADADLVPDPDAASVADLTEGSDLVGALHATPLPDQVDLTTIGAALDYVVPASHASTAGATEVMVNPISGNAHRAVLDDPQALRAVRSALEGAPPPCVPFSTALAGAVVPTVISRVEDAVALAGAAAGVVLPDG